MKRLRLKADSITANRLANRSEFIGVLKKVDGFRLPDVEKRKGFLGRLSLRPSITQRIQNFQVDASGAGS